MTLDRPVPHLDAGGQGHQNDLTTVTNPPLKVLRLPDQAGLRVIGEVDLTTRDGWRNALAALHVNGTSVRLDLSELTYIDVQGCTALVAAAHQIAPTPLTLYQPPPSLRRALALLWPGQLPTIAIEDMEEAG